MSSNSNVKPLAAALGTGFVVTLATAPVANAADNPFALNEFDDGHLQLAEEGACGEGKCGEGEGACGEGEGACGEGEGTCGEGEGACGEGEGKCGEGKCGE